MKRFSSEETLDAIVYPPQGSCTLPEKKNKKNSFVYSTEFQTMLDNLEDEDYTEEIITQTGDHKKRRLSPRQVKALEKIFEADNKLDPDSKEKIASDLGLQQRQVAIWFQNRRARWKTKRMEREYGVLKAEYEALEVNFDRLEKEREALIAELKELRSKLEDENSDSNHSIDENTPTIVNNVTEKQGYIGLKNGLIFNNNFHGNYECSGSVYSSWVKIEEENGFFNTAEEEPSNFFSLDQAPTIHWHY